MIVQYDEFSRFRASLRYSQQSAHTEFLHLWAIQYPAFQAKLFGDQAGAVCQFGGGQDIGRLVHHVTRKIGGLRQHNGALQSLLEMRIIG